MTADKENVREILVEVLNDMRLVYHGYGLDNSSVNLPQCTLSRLKDLKETYNVERRNTEDLNKIMALLNDNKEMINFFMTFEHVLDAAISLKKEQVKDD